MGFFDKARRLFGLGDASDDEAAPAPPATDLRDARGRETVREPASQRARDPKGKRDRRDRPPLAEPPAGAGRSIEDVLAAREAGDLAEARKILAEIDRGQGLRTVLRAAAALEAGDEDDVTSLLPAVAAEASGWKLLLQVAGALGDPAEAAPWVDRAAEAEAPAWAIAWTRAMSDDEAIRREGLVELLFTDAPLARTVAARDLGAAGVVADPEATTRWAAFSHGRDSIRRFGAHAVASLVDRALAGPAKGGAPRGGKRARS